MLKEYDLARKSLENSIQLERNWKSYFKLGITLMKIDQYKEAIDLFGRSIRMKENWKTYKYLGIALIMNNQPKKAQRMIDMSYALKVKKESTAVVISG